MSIVFKKGNLFESNCDVIVNAINCVGVMGKGIALEFKKKFPKMFNDYKERCQSHAVRPGEPYFYLVEPNKYILNFPTKNHWKEKSKMDYVIDGLKWFCNNYQKYNFHSIAFPALGCGNGGLSFTDVKRTMVSFLDNLDLDIVIYEPSLSNKDNSASSSADYNEALSIDDVTNSLPILSAVKEFVFRSFNKNFRKDFIFKIAYLMDFMGVETKAKFQFKSNEYKFYSSYINQLISYWQKNKILNKDRFNNYSLNPSFEFNEDFNEKCVTAIYKTVDFLSREKNEKQSDIDIYLIYLYKKLSKNKRIISDKELFETFMIKCKDFADSSSFFYKEQISSAIVNLAMRNFIKLRYSGDVSYDERFL